MTREGRQHVTHSHTNKQARREEAKGARDVVGVRLESTSPGLMIVRRYSRRREYVIKVRVAGYARCKKLTQTLLAHSQEMRDEEVRVQPAV